jgi:hypothetical protein
MPTRVATVSLSSIGTSAGPFTISDNVLGVIATGVTSAQLLAGFNVNTDVNSTQITITSTGACTNSISYNLVNPTLTPTPTPAVTSTPTPTATPTITPVLFDSSYTGYLNICGQGGKVWTRLRGPVGSVIGVELYTQHYILSISGPSACISGRLSTTTLPQTTPPESTLLAEVFSSILAVDVPSVISDATTTNITIPTSGYQDIILVYRTTNLTSGFSNGNVQARIKVIDGVTITNGDFIQTTYACSDAGICP